MTFSAGTGGIVRSEQVIKWQSNITHLEPNECCSRLRQASSWRSNVDQISGELGPIS